VQRPLTFNDQAKDLAALSDVRKEPTTTDKQQREQPTSVVMYRDKIWNSMFEGLVSYKAKHGKFPLLHKKEVFHNGKD
jgi:hypothetical protein